MSSAEKIAVVTGATGALGSEMAVLLAGKGYDVVLVARNGEKARQVAARIEQEGGRAEVKTGDFADLNSSKRLAAELAESFPAIDVLVNNAAVFSGERKVTKDGLELMFATNHLGPFLVTNSLVGSLQAAAPARIVSISAPTTTKLDFDDLQSEKDYGPYRAFGASKMCNLLTTFRLSRTLDSNQVTANVVHPGLIKSELMSDTPAILGGLLKAISRRPKAAAGTPVWVATDPQLAGVSGAFFKGKKIGKPAPYSRDESAQDRLWELSEELVR